MDVSHVEKADSPRKVRSALKAFLREDDARQDQRRGQRERRSRRDDLKGGLVTVAVGVGLMIMFRAVAPGTGVWTVGLIPLLIGIVLFLFALFSRLDGSAAEQAGGSRA